MQITVHKRLYRIAVRELRRIVARPIYLFCMVIAPIFCYIFFTTLMANGLPVSMPAGVVDMDNTATTRTIIRNLDAFQQTRVTAHYANFYEARKAVQRGEIYAFYYIPEGTTEEAIAIMLTSLPGHCSIGTSARCRNLPVEPSDKAHS